ncbi:MAG: AMP-binding protein, partial [Methylococcales bacterium]|nr:AMP-binding protein [Methylococcales bacterium]
MNKKTFRELVPESAEWQTFVDVLRSHAQSRGNEVAYVYLKDGETEGARITFAELDAKVRAIAAKLQQSTCPGDRVLLMFAPGIEYISAYLGCLYAGVIAIPAYPPRNKRYLARFQSIVSDSQAAIGLTSSDLLPNIVTMFAQAQGLQMLKLISTDDMELSLADGWQTVDISGATTAFLQYTSGSTGSPKGVIVSHGNLLHNEQVIVTHTDMAQSHGIVSWVPPYHDLGLILGLLCPLYMGKKSVIMAPFAFIQSPYRWLKAISDFSDQKICSGAPNFAYDLCSRRITAEQKATLDLSHWDVAFNGAEPISAQTYDRFVDAFAECGFQPNARYPVYGLAESTLMTAGGPPQTPMVVLNLDSEALGQNRVSIVEANEQSRQHVGCGQVNLEQEIHIVDPDTHLECSGHRVGEIWVKGGSIAQGYWNRPQETANSFHAMIKESQLGPFLRTGDLGFVHEGELFVTGRIKDVIIVRGRNHYPQDIENTVATADPSQGKGITPIRFGNVAAIAVTEDGLEKVVVVAEVERHYLQTCRRFQTEDHIEAPEEVSDYRTLDPNIVIGVIRQEVAEVHDIQLAAVVLIRPERLPKTSSGKIQHHQTGVDYQNGDLPVVWHSEFSKPDTCHDDIVVIIEQISPEDICLDRLLVMPIDERANWLKQALQSHVARSLHLAMEVIDSEMPLSQLGIDSLIAVEMGHLIESGFSVQIDSFALLDGMTLSELVESVLGQLQEEATSDTPPLVRIEEFHPEYPLSQGQRAMWFLHRFAPENLAYNVTIPAKIEQPLNMPVLQRAFQALLDRHPALRTTYHSKEGEPVVYVEEDSQLFFTLEDASGWSQNAIDDWLKKLAKTPFDLENGPLFRVNVVSDGDTCYLLMSAHHIAVDMWSVVILMDELKLYYAAYLTGEQITLPELPYRYTDYVQWQIQLLKSDAGDRMWQYWKNQLAGCHPILELPTDRPRPPVQTYQGDTVSLELNSAVTDRVKSFAKETNTTVYMVLLGAFQVLLHRYTGQQDLLVGSPVAGRTKAGLEGVVGYFVDPVVLRAKFRHGENFIDFMQQVKQTVLGALSNQDYPFSEIVKRIYPARDPSRSPLFQALFVLQKTYQMKGESISGFVLGEAGGRLNMADVALESMSIETQVAMFDIMLTMTEGDGQLRGSFQYNSDLFEQSTIAIMALHLETLLQGLLSESDSPMSDIPLMTEADRYL